MKPESKIIEELVDENFIYAKVLHYFGVHFYDNRKKTLDTVCIENNIEQEKLDVFLQGITSEKNLSTTQLNKYPAGLIIEYLKHAHQIFIKEKLPYILKLVGDIRSQSKLINDLRFILPIFVEDFIKHIYEEEDRLFSYIQNLEVYIKGAAIKSTFVYGQNNFSIQEFALHHDDSDQEMKGIRGITFDYNTNELEDIHLKVLFKELKQFDAELTHHATIENEILFPKALALEKLAFSKFQLNSTLN